MFVGEDINGCMWWYLVAKENIWHIWIHIYIYIYQTHNSLRYKSCVCMCIYICVCAYTYAILTKSTPHMRTWFMTVNRRHVAKTIANLNHPPESPWIGSINHSQVSGLLLFYPHDNGYKLYCIEWLIYRNSIDIRVDLWI